jgi:tetratricopeptide (TPR) repeat protein
MASVKKTRRVSAPSTPVRPPRRLPVLLVGLLLLIAIVAFIRLSPLLREQKLETSSLTELENMAREEKDNPRILYHLARRQEESGQVRAAMDTYWRALQRAPDNEAGWLGWMRTTEAVLGPVQAQKVLELWLQASPRNVTADSHLARLHQRRADFPRAYETAMKGTALDAENGELWQIMGSAAIMMGKPSEAETAFRRAVTINPEEWRNHTGLSDALSRLSRQAEAVAAAQEAVRRAPQEPIPHLLLGTALLQSARNDAEIEAARAELLKIDRNANSLPPPGQFQLALTLGESYKRQRQWREALAAYQQAEQLRPYDPIVPYNLMRVYRGLGDQANLEKTAARYKTLDGYNQEIKVLTSRLEAIPNDTQARLKLARLYATCEQFEQAILNYQTLLAQSPQMASARKELDTLLACAAQRPK